MSRMSTTYWAALGCRILLGVIFVLAGEMKLEDIQSFADSIASYRMLPTFLISLCALGLPLLEIILGTALLLGWQTRACIFGILILTVVFTIALAQAYFRSLKIHCGCFGLGGSLVDVLWIDFVRDVVLLLLALGLYIYCIKRKGMTGEIINY